MSLTNIKELIDFGKTLNILYIEDNDEVREQIFKLLSNFFSNIDISADGDNALEKYNDFYKKNNQQYVQFLDQLARLKGSQYQPNDHDHTVVLSSQ